MKLTPLFLAITMAVSGCATSLNPQIAAVKPAVEASKAEALQLITRPAPAPEFSNITFSEQSWVALRKIERANRGAANEQTDAALIEINQRFQNLNEVASVISSLTGFPVSIAPDVPVASATVGMPGMPGAPQGPGGMPTGMPGGSIVPAIYPSGGAGSMSSPANNGQIGVNSPFSANYSGSLTGFMNKVTAYYGIFWKADSSSLRLFLMDSKTFRIAALPGDTRLSSTVESSSNSNGSSGSAGASTGTGATQSGASANSTGVAFAGLSVWSALETGIKQMLGTGGRVIASPATGTITVTDTPTVLARVSEFINGQNQALNRQVTVKVRVLSVELNEGDNYGVNWDAVYSHLASASNPYSLAMKTAFPFAAGAGNMILSAPASSTSRWAGSSAMFSALSTQGRVRELTSATLITLNNQAAPVNVGRRVSYLASSSTTQTANVGATTALTPGSIQTGFSMTLVPHIIDSKELLLQYSLDLSSLLKLSTITSGNSSIQAPDISTSNFIQRVRIQTGETLVVAGYDQDNLSAVSSGVGTPDNVALGGSREGATKRTLLVVLIQPIISQ